MKDFLKYFLRPENEAARMRVALATIMIVVFVLFHSLLVYVFCSKWLD